MKIVAINFLSIASIVFSFSVASAGSGISSLTVKQITVWAGSGNAKIYLNQSGVNGKEGCSATDNSIAILGSAKAVDEIIKLATAAKISGSQLNAWVHGCCLSHSGKQSPCIHTLTLKN